MVNNGTNALARQIELSSSKATLLALYRFATAADYIILAGAAIGAILGGAALPLRAVIFGQLVGAFQESQEQQMASDELSDQVTYIVPYFVYLSIWEFITVALSILGFFYIGNRLSCQNREHFLEACRRQNIGFFDSVSPGEITTRITADIDRVQEGISEKLALALAPVATLSSAFIIGFIMNWNLTLIMSSVAVVIITIMNIGSLCVTKHSTKALDLYAVGGTVADEAFNSIRNVKAYGAQEKLAVQYDSHLRRVEKRGFRMQVVMGIMYCLTFFVMYLGYGLAFWQGARLLLYGMATMFETITIPFAIMTGTLAVGNMSSNLQALIRSVSAAGKNF